jgi:short subunit dehydrogenase-like uncharacterized protein
MNSRSSSRDLDIVVFGATGFVGRLVAGYLASHAPGSARIGLAGRSEQRLAALRHELGGRARDWPLLVADAGDPVTMQRLAEQARVVAPTVGPYARHGLPLVEACARAGTHYADLTGEVLFVREAVRRYHDLAATTGARIVCGCGFDAVPSDLAVLLAAEAAARDGAGELGDTTLVVRAARGGFSGGTFDSLRTQLDEIRSDRRLLKIVRDPYALSPDRDAEPDLDGEGEQLRPRYDAGLGTWTGPFVMAPYNTRIVRRSNALQEWAYGREFRYREVVAFGSSPVAPVLAGVTTAGLGVLAGGMVFPPTRFVLDRALPKPGQGPGARTRERGHFHIEVHARTTNGPTFVVTIAAQGDPGYQATSVMFAESALALSHDGHALPDFAGVLTPATGIGRVLADRLRDAGFTITTKRAR